VTLVDGALTQLRVVHALALRETRTRFGAHKLGYLWALLEPIFWILTFWGLFEVAGRHTAHGMDVIPFLATGIIPYTLFSQSTDRNMAAIAGNKALLFYPQVQTLDITLARGALEMATYVMVFIVLLGGNALVEHQLVFANLLRTLWGMALAGMLGTSLGLVLCSLSVVSNSVERIKGPLFRPLFWVSGLFFTADELSSSARDALLWNPILHCIEITREGWFPTYRGGYGSSAYVLMWIIGFAFIGLTLERRVRAKVQLT